MRPSSHRVGGVGSCFRSASLPNVHVTPYAVDNEFFASRADLADSIETRRAWGAERGVRRFLRWQAWSGSDRLT